ncbi:hypothetical protein SAMN06295974_1703 [Plantibacter flavus]|uniref:PH (Pleckstrin Homology) domain-containing protein n=1 Tax=Plantibacter flavus TaxID=150123 RepID=A0A3N2C817_9MICO|nr:hypothetical protein [Plantibacter flavus]ROR83632.1 hypothetical protein EDD42_3746 [Plantibacter flavus]SMG25664.1 hypothetical protein SAMN06295974_1703 [Plantibacter flavus]
MSDSINTWGGTATREGAKPLFVVRRPRYQSLMFEILGGLVAVIGLFGGLGELVSDAEDGVSSFGFFLLFFVGGGGLVFVFGLLLSAGRIQAYDRHLDVKSGFGRYRRREVGDIHTLRFGSQSQGGGPTFISLTAWDERRKKQFTVFTGYRGYGELSAWLEQRRPEQWADCERAGVPR